MALGADARSDIHERLLDETPCACCPRCEKSAVLAVDRRGVVLPAATRGFAESSVRAHDLPQRARAWWAG